MRPQVKQAIEKAKAHLGYHPHPDWLVKVLGISEKEAREALVEDGWKDPEPPAPAQPPSASPAPKPKAWDLHDLPAGLVRGGMAFLAVLATVREFGYTFGFFSTLDNFLGAVVMALLVSGGSTVLPQAVAILWPKRGAGYKILGAAAALLGLAVLGSSIWITTNGLYNAQGAKQEAAQDQGAEAQAQELEAIIKALESQIEDTRADLQGSRDSLGDLEGWRKAQEQARGDRLAGEVGELTNRLEARRLELSQTKGALRVRGDLVETLGQGWEIAMAVTLGVIISFVGPLALGVALWGGLDKNQDMGIKLRRKK